MVGLVLTIVVSCTHRTEAPLSLHWELIANDVEPGICEAELTIRNNTSQAVSNDGWMVGFGLMSLHTIYTKGEQLRETEDQDA